MMRKLILVCFALLTHRGFALKSEGDSCLDENTQTQGRCVILEQCESAKEDIQKYKVQPTPCNFTVNSLLVCCRDPPTISDTTTSGALVSSCPSLVASKREPGVISNQQCEEFTKLVTQTVTGGALSLYPEKQVYTGAKCKNQGTQLIIGGTRAAQGEFPHMAAIGWRTFNGEYIFECGGTLISVRFVLTAGHCTRFTDAANEDPEIVRLGDQNLDPKVLDGADPVEIPISHIHKYPCYKYSKRYNDIALLELKSYVKFNDNIRPACLWTKKDFGNNKKALATGWGIIDSATNEKSNELLKVSLNILNSTSCNDTLVDQMNRRWIHGFDDTQMCAGDPQQTKDTCQGDSGSPLQVVSEENKCIYKVIGITSFGAKFCGHAPAVYTKISSYIGWIEDIVWPSE